MVANSVGQTAGRNQSNKFDSGNTQRNPSENISGGVDELSDTNLATLGVDFAVRGGSRSAARLRNVRTPVLGRALTAALKLKR